MVIDCDDVILSWASSFDGWVARNKGFQLKDPSVFNVFERYGVKDYDVGDLVKEFHRKDFDKFPPLNDAVEGMVGLFEKYGTTYTVITSIDRSLLRKRWHNLQNIFGYRRSKVMFRHIYAAGNHGCKRPFLKHFKDSGLFFVDDHPRNIVAAYELGLQPIFYRNDINHDPIQVPHLSVSCWDHIRMYVDQTYKAHQQSI